MVLRFSLLLLALALTGASVHHAQEKSQDAPAEKPGVLPLGLAENGEKLFVEKGCHYCHRAAQTPLPAVDLAPRLVIELASESHASWTRDDYARAIMDPNHLVSEEYRIAMMRLGDNFKAENSPMPDFNSLLKVSELIHLATFLDSLIE